MDIILCSAALPFNLSNFLLLDEYIKVSQGAKEGSKKEEIWLLHNQELNCLAGYVRRRS